MPIAAIIQLTAPFFGVTLFSQENPPGDAACETARRRSYLASPFALTTACGRNRYDLRVSEKTGQLEVHYTVALTLCGS